MVLLEDMSLEEIDERFAEMREKIKVVEDKIKAVVDEHLHDLYAEKRELNEYMRRIRSARTKGINKRKLIARNKKVSGNKALIKSGQAQPLSEILKTKRDGRIADLAWFTKSGRIIRPFRIPIIFSEDNVPNGQTPSEFFDNRAGWLERYVDDIWRLKSIHFEEIGLAIDELGGQVDSGLGVEYIESNRSGHVKSESIYGIDMKKWKEANVETQEAK
jgi:hypothetical protein